MMLCAAMAGDPARRVHRFYTQAASDTLPLVPKNPPIFRKVQRSQSAIVDGKHLFLKECKKCGGDFYGIESNSL
jgi:hypothetical protein